MRRLALLALLAAPPAAAALALALLGGPARPAGAAEAVPDLGTDAQREAGKAVYDKWCGQCHGDAGDGRGIGAPFQLPPPRDFTAAKFKFRSTPFGTLPTDADLRRTIVEGLPYTAMPGFPELSDDEVTAVIAYLKTFADDWQDPRAYAEAIAIPDAPAFDAERAREEGYQAYVAAGCRACHGDDGRGDGPSAPTLRDDWGHFVRVADLTMPWTFRGGGTPEDIYRTVSTGINGTPMAGFTDQALPPEERWKIVHWIVAQAGGEGETAPYERLVRAAPVEGDMALPEDPAALAETFADAPAALFPVIGQIMEPGRAFQPAARAVAVQAIFNDDDIAFLVSWNDMSAERGGENRPDMPAPTVGERRHAGPADAASLWNEAAGGVSRPPGGAGSEEAAAAAGEGGAGDVWGADAGPQGADAPAGPPVADPWGDEALPAGAAPAPAAEPAAAQPSAPADPWGDDAAPAAAAAAAEGAAADPWGDDAAGSDVAGDAGADPFAGLAVEGAAPSSPYSDAIALQLPNALREGVVKPYFLFGDAGYPVELWHVALQEEPTTTVWEGRGSAALTPLDRRPPETAAHYEKGRWQVAFKRPRAPQGSVAFAEDAFVPLAVTVWDGFHHERGNLRGLTRWVHVYVPPLEAPSPVGPMIRAGLGVLALELLVVAWVRRRHKHSAAAPPTPATAPSASA
jgi:mono/diheme cytochrome c family protein